MELAKPNVPKRNVVKKDIDNFVKFVFDSLNKHLYVDDSQIFELKCGKYYSDTINFENKILTDYYQSVGNRVVSIDDISDSFNSSSTGSQFSAIASYENAYKYNRLFVLAKDITYTDERQFSVVNILQHNNVGYLNEYGNQTTYNISDNFDDTTYPELGSFDYGPTDTGWELEFSPNKTVYNEYELTTIGFNLLDEST